MPKVPYLTLVFWWTALIRQDRRELGSLFRLALTFLGAFLDLEKMKRTLMAFAL